MYCAGLAVESLLRAFRWTKDASFEGRHDLVDLLKASRLMQIDYDYLRRRGVPEKDVERSSLELRGAMNKVIVLWHNNLRFSSEARLKTFLNRQGKLKGIKGDPLKRNALDLLDAAQTVLDRGVALWISGKRS